ncbi:MAG: hypothetical protein II826_04630 [Prevotella sp.]|nr:hypothetical protein [Prevotella sp.]
MKKTYLQPALQVLRLNTNQFIAASPKINGDKAEVVLDDEEYNESFNSRRNSNVWDEEDEEE